MVDVSDGRNIAARRFEPIETVEFVVFRGKTRTPVRADLRDKEHVGTLRGHLEIPGLAAFQHRGGEGTE